MRWNYEDFEITYDCLEDQYKVYKYYLASLLIEKPNKAPYFSQIITKPFEFWSELNIQLMATLNDYKKKILIIKVLTVMYNQ